MNVGIDFHDTIVWMYVLKAVKTNQDFSDWKTRFRDLRAEDLIKYENVPRLEAYEKAEQNVRSLPAIPPQWSDRHHLGRIIGIEKYDAMTSYLHGEPTLEAPLKPGAKEGIEQLVLVDGHVPHIVTIIREDHFPIVSKYLERQRLSGLFGQSHRLKREENGGPESKVNYCLEHGIQAHIDDESRRLAMPDHLNNYNGRRFLGILLGAGISQDEAQRLEKDAQFAKLLGQGGINVNDFLNMLVEIGSKERLESPPINEQIARNWDRRHELVYAPRFTYVREAVNTFAQRISTR